MGELSQGQRILALLSDGREHSNGEVMTAPGGGLVGQYQRRLLDLRRRGFAISTGRQDDFTPNCWWYRWADAAQRQAWREGRFEGAARRDLRPRPPDPLAAMQAQARRARTRPRKRIVPASGAMMTRAGAGDLGLFGIVER